MQVRKEKKYKGELAFKLQLYYSYVERPRNVSTKLFRLRKKLKHKRFDNIGFEKLELNNLNFPAQKKSLIKLESYETSLGAV